MAGSGVAHDGQEADGWWPEPRPPSRITPFGVVGAMGVAVQVSLVSVLTRIAGLDVGPATAIAVEATILHNFAWHERWTWADQTTDHPAGAPGRLVRFNLVALGALALNVVVTTWLAGPGRLPVEVANLAAVILCSVVNFVAIERLVLWRVERGAASTGCQARARNGRD